MHARNIQSTNLDLFKTSALRSLSIFLLVCCSCTKSFELPEILEEFNATSHLRYKEVRRVCSHRDNFCRSRDPHVCTMRYVDGRTEHKEFTNICYLFLSNMCDNPDNEHHIVQGSSCNDYFNLRRSDDGSPLNISEITYENKTEDNTDNVTELNEKLSLRQRDRIQKFTPNPNYPEDGESFDGHNCPYICPDFYDPRCVAANKLYGGVHLRFMVFINHCQMDMHYCSNWKDYEPPPISSEEQDPLNVRESKLGWSYCGSSKYLQFARFSEAASSMGHYGWLAGDHRARHIMEPHERIPGYG